MISGAHTSNTRFHGGSTLCVMMQRALALGALALASLSAGAVSRAFSAASANVCQHHEEQIESSVTYFSHVGAGQAMLFTCNHTPMNHHAIAQLE